MKYSLNLATGTYVNHRRLFVVLTVVCMLLLGLLTFISMNVVRDVSRTHELKLRLEGLNAQKQGTNQQSEVSSAALEEMAQRIELANELLERDNYRWTELLDQIEAHFADGISIRDLQPDYKSGVLKLSGVAASLTDLRNFIDNLSRSEVFTHVYLKEQRTEKTKDDLTGGILFSIELQKGSVHES